MRGKFLQGLITNDIGKVHGADAVHAGLLSPQGKVLFDFFLVAEGDGFLVDVAREQEEELAKRLGFYRLRAAVEIAADPSREVAACWGGKPAEPGGAISMPIRRLPALGYRAFFAQGSESDGTRLRAPRPSRTTTPSASASACRKAAEDYAFGDVFPHEALFDQLNGVDFKKGCFVGQEVVSRMEHRGTARKRIVPVEGARRCRLRARASRRPAWPSARSARCAGRRALRSFGSTAPRTRLARGETLAAGGVEIALRRPAFASFAVPPMEVRA